MAVHLGLSRARSVAKLSAAPPGMEADAREPRGLALSLFPAVLQASVLSVAPGS